MHINIFKICLDMQVILLAVDKITHIFNSVAS